MRPFHAFFAITSDKTSDFYECHNASKDSKRQKRELLSHHIAQTHSIERESEAKGLPNQIPNEIGKLSDIVALFAVAISCVGAASGGDDLETKSHDACRNLALR